MGYQRSFIEGAESGKLILFEERVASEIQDWETKSNYVTVATWAVNYVTGACFHCYFGNSTRSVTREGILA